MNNKPNKILKMLSFYGIIYKKQSQRKIDLNFMQLITERPAAAVKCIVFIIVLALAAAAIIIKRIANKTAIKKKTQKNQKSYGVTVYLGTDNMIRFVPQVENKAGIFVPIQEGVEIPFTNNPYEIGQAYCKARDNSLSHYGEDLDMRKQLYEYKMFKSFKSQKSFDTNHCCMSSFATDNLEFRYLLWHKRHGGFCSLTDDIEIIEIIDVNSDFTTIGNTILKILKTAKSEYPDTPALCNEHNSSLIDS